jgi:hypothetical protein
MFTQQLRATQHSGTTRCRRNVKDAQLLPCDVFSPGQVQ